MMSNFIIFLQVSYFYYFYVYRPHSFNDLSVAGYLSWFFILTFVNNEAIDVDVMTDNSLVTFPSYSWVIRISTFN